MPQYPPGGPGIAVDGIFDDWAGYPEETLVTLDNIYVHAGAETKDATDWDVTIMWSWNDALNVFCVAVEVFDDIYNPVPVKGEHGTCNYDDMEMGTDGDGSGGFFHSSDAVAADEWGEQAQQWGFSPSPEPYFQIYNIQGATWMYEAPYTEYWGIVQEEATGWRMFHELYMVLWDHLAPEGPNESIPHDLEEGDVVGISFLFCDYDADPSKLEGQWKTHERPDGAKNANAWPDVNLLGTLGWEVPTAVQPASWGAIKATFAR
jgi:hypothetical protein